jgi:hypothetical protein
MVFKREGSRGDRSLFQAEPSCGPIGHMAGPVSTLTDAKTFTESFFRLANASPPPHGEARLGTEWFEKLMLDLARNDGLYCQNRQSPVPGEWMKIDHVFVSKNDYQHFPLIAVEHENGDISRASKAGNLPAGNTPGAYIEWATWKMLAMQAALHVLVAYPWKADKTPALLSLSRIVEGYFKTFGTIPNALFLLGWWDRSCNGVWSAEGLYEAYVPEDQGGAISLARASWSPSAPP